MADATAVAQDYRNLPACGGYALDRPETFKELMEALKTRVVVAEEAGAFAEYFSTFWYGKENQADEIVKSSRWILAFPVVGSNEGYYIHLGAMKEGVYTELALVKVLGSREDVQRITHEINELLLRM